MRGLGEGLGSGNYPPHRPQGLLIQAEVSFRPRFKVGKTTDMFFIYKNLRNGFYRLTRGFIEVRFGDPFRMDIDIAVTEIITLCG